MTEGLAGETRTAKIEIRVRPSEKAEIERLAAERGLKPAEYARRLLLNPGEPMLLPAELAVLSELRAQVR